MKRLRRSTGAKLGAIILLILFGLTFLASLGGVIWMNELGAYTGMYPTVWKTLMRDMAREMTRDAEEKVIFRGADPAGVFPDGNFMFEILDGSGRLLFSNVEGEICAEFSEKVSYGVYTTDDNVRIGDINHWLAGEEDDLPEAPIENFVAGVVEMDFVVRGCIAAAIRQGDTVYARSALFGAVYELRYGMIAAALGAFLLCVLLFVFLMSAAGLRDESGEAKPGFAENIPYDIFTAAIAGLLCALVALADASGIDGVAQQLLLVLLCIAAALLLLLWCMSTAVRIKTKTLVKDTLLYRFFSRLWVSAVRIARWLYSVIRGIPLVGRGAAILTGWMLLELFFMAAFGAREEQYVLWLLERLLLVPLILWALICVRKLREGAKALAAGKLDGSIDTRSLYGELRAHADDLNSIRDGVSKAVEERMKSERLKTELITNVSHDIKTPLTSIVNYVDLLSRETPENGKAAEYIAVLQRQSARLKKLTEDLVEASKASTGNLEVSLSPCDFGVLLEQTAGEYGERLREKNLELIVKKPEIPVVVMADGRHMWRVFDNLMNNIMKYGQPGTRVYLTLTADAERASLVFRNTSRYPLNVDGDELTERFVRGDSSRSTEGSGLGLAIAQSLIELQGGHLHITVDGDLFKVTISFDAPQ